MPIIVASASKGDEKGPVAQSVEQRIENPCVGGSIPSQATRFKASVLKSPEAFLHLGPLASM